MQRSLTDVLRAIGEVADFSDIPVTDANTLGLFKIRPVHVAAVWGDCEAIELPVRAGASIDRRGEHGFTPHGGDSARPSRGVSAAGRPWSASDPE